MLKRLTAAVLLLCLLSVFAPAVWAEPEEMATNITFSTVIISNGYDNLDFLTDGKLNSYRDSNGKCTITFMNENGIGGIYLRFDEEYGEYKVENAGTGDSFTAGQYGFLHDYIDVSSAFDGPVTSVTLHFSKRKVRLSEAEVYSAGTVPDNVQVWQPPLDNKTDILLLSAHGDDDQLFFAGLLPKYAGQEQVGVQVAYLTDHRNLTNQRTHEILNGLWAVGCTAYPIMPDFPDFRIDDLADTYQEFDRLGHSEEKLLGYVVELLRRFKPQVVVGHDINGEYGHGMHMVYTDCLLKALKVSNDETFLPEMARSYGLWDVPKTYLHLYKENTIELDYDDPLEAFGGMTAFEVSQELGYPCHKSQQNTWFTDWLYGDNNEITKATQIKRHNPCFFGLYRSTVGEDVKRNDFLENITTYREQEIIEQEQAAQEPLPEDDKSPEELEQELQELERLEAERAEQKRQEEERLAQERLEQERIRALEQQRQQRISTVIVGCLVIIALAMIPIAMVVRRKAAKRRSDD